MNECFVFMCICAPPSFRVFAGQKRVSNPLGLELHMIINDHMDVGNQARNLSLEEQPVLFTSEPFPQPRVTYLIKAPIT